MEETLCTIRETNRSVLNINRRRFREQDTDQHRSLSTLCITPEKVTIIANNLRTKSLITVTELRNLKNALIDDEKNIQIVLNTQNAMRGLVRELSGHNERKQCEAAGCCCNLALGESRACTIVAKAAGPYLIAALNNLNTQFAVMCTWTLGNLAGSGVKATELLIAQGVIGKLTDQLTILNQDLSDATIEALTQFVYQLKDNLSTDHFHGILSKLQELSITTPSLHLLFVLSCHKDFSAGDIKSDYLEKIIESFYIAMRTSHDGNVDNLLYLVRTLANFDNINIYEELLNNFVINNTSVYLNQVLNNSILNENLLWLLGNMFNVCYNHEFFRHLIK